MNRLIKKILLIVLVFIGLMIVSNVSNASDLELKNLNYDVKLNSDGTANVVETWRISIENTNTLFKTFDIDKSKYKEITDVKVSEVNSNGTKNSFIKTNEYKYHVDKNYYYALMNNGKFEIAWGVHAKDITRTYEISYKIVDAIKNYSDCSEFYWQFIGNTSDIPADFVKGTIQLPISVSNKEELKVWAHGPLNGNIWVESNNTVIFEVAQLNAKTMLEARVVTPNTIFANNLNSTNTTKLKSILAQEQTWADEANAERERVAKQKEAKEKAIRIGLIISNIVGAILAVVIIIKIMKYHKELKDTPKVVAQQQLDYFRDIPDENATPAEAGFLYYFKAAGMQANISKIISATMLDLCMKKYLEFEVVQDKKNSIKVKLTNNDKSKLSEDEKIVYNLLDGVSTSKEFTMKEFEKYVSKNATTITLKFTSIEESAKKEQERKENYSKELITKSEKWNIKAVGYIFLAVAGLFAMQIVIIPAIIAVVYCFILYGRYNRLTQKGINEKEQWVGLKKYMEEFSMINEKTVPELVLWEKYLVYATAFGIADKVLKQLKVVYPQITDSEYMMSNGYAYMYLMYSGNLNHSFINTLNTSVNTSYNNISSGSGAGGGFSGGGGFGGGGGRNGRKIKLFYYVQKYTKKQKQFV